jgi:hypothetical protein
VGRLGSAFGGAKSVADVDHLQGTEPCPDECCGSRIHKTRAAAAQAKYLAAPNRDGLQDSPGRQAAICRREGQAGEAPDRPTGAVLRRRVQGSPIDQVARALVRAALEGARPAETMVATLRAIIDFPFWKSLRNAGQSAEEAKTTMLGLVEVLVPG